MWVGGLERNSLQLKAGQRALLKRSAKLQMGDSPSPQEHSCHPPGQLTSAGAPGQLPGSLRVVGKIRTVIAVGDADEGSDSSVNIINLLLIHT